MLRLDFPAPESNHGREKNISKISISKLIYIYTLDDWFGVWIVNFRHKRFQKVRPICGADLLRRFRHTPQKGFQPCRPQVRFFHQLRSGKLENKVIEHK